MQQITHVREDAELLTWYPLALGLAPHAVVAALHQCLLQPHGVLDELVILQTRPAIATLSHLEALQQGVEAGVVTLAQQQQQVQASDLAGVAAAAREHALGQGVEGLQRVEVASEALGILLLDADERAQFENLARGEEMWHRCGGRRDEGVEFEEGEFGARKQLGCR